MSKLLALVKDDLGYAGLETSLAGEGLLSSSPLWRYCGFLHMSRGASSCRTPFDQFDISKNQLGTGCCDLLAPNARCAGEDGGSISVPTFVGVDDVGDNDVVDVDSERLGSFLSSSNE